ncbi:MAG: tRNA (adenosine(37)-N6)-dimethylallyltransferase MiaA [Actinobacteria bacterium]|nr:tRNA (adenosine(37)-N6)-dimethylallyltransferase MiaA [Actinomycetota bacterium]
MDEYDLIASQIKSFNNDYIFKIKNKLLSEKYLIIICGPTAIGKSKIALILAMIFNTNLISVDSMQSYIGMDIGTDKQDFNKYGVKQFLINICKPDHFLTSVEYRDNAREIIKCEFFNKSKIPILAGGSGLHIRAIVDDLMEAPEGDHDLRKRIKNEISIYNLEHFYEKLKNIDPLYASKISPNDERRIIRALEVYEKTGKKFSDFQNKWKDRKSIYNCIFIGLNSDRKKLYENIENRINEMIKNGLVEEVEKLVKMGYKNSFSMQQAIGYKELIKYFDGKQTLENAIDEIKKNTKHLAKKQITWFKADNRINWIAVNNYDNIYNLINEILKIIYSRIFYEKN